MSTISALQSGLSAIQSMQNNAAKIADPSAMQSAADLTEPLVEMMHDEQVVQAAAKMIETGTEMMGTILDVIV